MYCPHCGHALSDGAKFCANCGSQAPDPAAVAAPEPAPGATRIPVTPPPADPAPVTPPPVTPAPATPPPVTPTRATPPPVTPAPGGTPEAAPGAEQIGAALGSIGRWDWLGSIRVALTLLVTSGVLALIAGIAGRPAIPGVHYTTHTSIAWLIWLWTSVFGTHLTSSAGVVGSSSAHASAGGAAWPLTLTVITFAAGIWVFRRATAGITSPLSMIGFVVRTALLTAIPLWILSFFGHIGVHDVLRLANQDEYAADVKHYVKDFSLGASSTGALFVTFLVVLVVLLLATLTRADVYGRPYEYVRSWVSGAVKGAAGLLVVLVPAGLIAELVVWLMKPKYSTGHITVHGAINIIAGCISYSVNAGVAALSLGSLGKFGGGYDTSVDMGKSEYHGVSWWTGHGSYVGPADHGFYVAIALAPLILIAVAWIVRRTRAADALPRMGGWLISLLAVLPLLMHFSGGQMWGDVSGRKAVGLMFSAGELGFGDTGGVPSHVSGHIFGGVPSSSMWLVLLYAIIIGIIVAFVTGAVTSEAMARFRSGAAKLKPIQPTDSGQQRSAPVVYQIGDVVNGHRFDGERWVPLE